jgi:DNA polymerase III subunit epsilon
MMYAVIDLETTGGSAAKDRITEIAIVLHDGQRTVDTFSTLINPERPIPSYITDITGISDAMVAGAPRFYEVARQVVELTNGCIFVAHNVNFDYSFLREEFRRLAYDYQREKLCTVRTSRQLIPGLSSYSLGRLCQSLGIQIHARHRALGDAEATVKVLERLIHLNPGLGKQQRKPARDPYAGIGASVNRENLSALPEDPGLYFFHGPGGNVLHVNANRNIRQAALKELLQLSKESGKSNIKIEEICEVTWELTGNELLAQLRLEAEQDVHQSVAAPKIKASGKFGIHAYSDQRGYQRLYIDKIQKGKASFGKFATEADARAALEARLLKHRLCRQLGGLEQGVGACSWHLGDGGGCVGACMGLESATTYNERLETALAGLGFPFPAFFVFGEGRNHQEIAVIGVEGGNLLGFAYLDADRGWDNPHEIKDFLRPLPATESMSQVLRQYLSKNLKTKLVPF